MQPSDFDKRERAADGYDSPLEVFAYASKLVRRDMQAAVDMFRQSQQQTGDRSAEPKVVNG